MSAANTASTGNAENADGTGTADSAGTAGNAGSTRSADAAGSAGAAAATAVRTAAKPATVMTPTRWTPPPNPHPVRRRGDTRTLPKLRVEPLPGVGPEHIALAPDGSLYAGLGDGRVVRIVPDSDEPVRTLATTGGRPLGLEVAPDGGSLVVCDAYRGLLRVALSGGAVEVLCGSFEGETITFCSNAAFGDDGTVYFTQSSRRYNIDSFRGDLLEHSDTGRLFRYRDGAVELVADGFAFANGVVLSLDGSAAIVAETGAYRLTRVDLATGAKTPFAAELPAFPDNLTRDEHGLIWIAMVSPRDPLLDLLLPQHPRFRGAVWATPERLQPGPKDIAWVRAVDESGATVHDLRGWSAGYRMVTAARRAGDRLYLGSLIEPAIAVLDIPE